MGQEQALIAQDHAFQGGPDHACTHDQAQFWPSPPVCSWLLVKFYLEWKTMYDFDSAIVILFALSHW